MNKSIKRRTFLKTASLASGAFFVPSFLQATSPNQLSTKGKKLVVVQLSGGNDGLNTFVPYRNDEYYRLRPRLAVPSKEVLRLTDEYGLHSNLTGLKSLYDEGLVSVVNNVGYPNPNRSHFRSMDIWHTASASDEYLNTGWLGRWLDSSCAKGCTPRAALEVSKALSLALKGGTVKGVATDNIKQFYESAKEPFIHAVAHQQDGHHDHDNVAYLHKTLVDVQQSATYLHEKSKLHQSRAAYPTTPIGKQLKMIAELIISGSDTVVYYATLGGFDTHAGQKWTQGKLLKQYSEAIKVFVNDLKRNNCFDETLVFTFSEFGRRVAQNSSGGTDHGTANNVWLIGNQLKHPGIFNELPDLVNLDKGDLKYSIDFRSIYANLLENWLQSSPKGVVEGVVKAVSLV